MSVKDLIKKSVLELDMFKNSFTPEKILQMVIALGVALLMGLVICFIYNRFFRGVVYNRSFAVTLVGMTVLTCMVTLAISTNVVLSLGMVGALSIVRYRTAVKDRWICCTCSGRLPLASPWGPTCLPWYLSRPS